MFVAAGLNSWATLIRACPIEKGRGDSEISLGQKRERIRCPLKQAADFVPHILVIESTDDVGERRYILLSLTNTASAG